jgi:hypothetical protein
VATNTVSNSSAGYQTYQPQAYQSSVTTFTSPITQSSGAYQSAAQSVSKDCFSRNFIIAFQSANMECFIWNTHQVYASPYGSYASQPPAASHNHKLNSTTTKDSQYDSSATTSNSSLATTSAPTLGLTSTSVNSSQTKVTNSNG